MDTKVIMAIQNLAQKYLSQKVNYGGEITTVAAVIKDLKKSFPDVPRQQVDMYIAGLLRKK